MIFATIRCHTCGLVVIISRRKVFLLSLSQLVTMMNRIAAMTRSNTKAYLNMLSTSSMMTEESAKAILSKLRGGGSLDPLGKLGVAVPSAGVYLLADVHLHHFTDA